MIDLYTRVYDGKLYDHLTYFYFQEREGGTNGAYIPLNMRQPSVKIPFCKLVVDNSVSLLFGNDHFPKIGCEDDTLREKLEEMMTDYKFNAIMSRSATIGSTGSVIIFVNIYDGILKLEPKSTKNFTPVFDKVIPNKLIKLTERYKVSGALLIAQGYTNIKEPKKKYWFHRVWDENSEIWYVPYLCSEKDPKLKVDKKRSTIHNLGLLPAKWIKNLNKILDFDDNGAVVDGECTFARVVDANIEIDYQLSQGGRALKYSSDPLLVLKLEDDQMTLQQNMTQVVVSPSNGEAHAALNPGIGGTGKALARSASNALILNKDDEAKLLEIGGTAINAVLEFVRNLREYLLETAHGNRSNADKVNAAQSGRAMQAMNQALIWLTDNLRVSYGEGGLLEIIQMIIEIVKIQGFGIFIGGKFERDLNPSNEKITLAWPPWYPDTPGDRVQSANAIKTNVDAGVLSKETGTKNIADDYNIEDIAAETSRIAQDAADLAALNPKVTEVKNI